MAYIKKLLLPGLLIAVMGSACVPAGPLPEATPERRTATLPEREVVHEEVAPRSAPVVVGVIVSQSGTPFLERFGEQVLEGIRLAVDAHHQGGGAPVELVTLDDEGDPGRVGSLVSRLEERGAVAIVGPLRPEGVAVAAGARHEELPLILSPTAPDLPVGGHIYSLNAVDARGAEMMASYALASGLRRVALLYSEAPEYRRQADAFRAALVRGGGVIVSEVAYAPGTTTFADPLQMLAKASPDAVFIPAPERDVRQIAPQITYYGLAATGAAILGGTGWSGDEVLHEVAARYLEGVVATTPLYRPSPEFGWTDFVTLYEETYRRSLDNALPALGYDATRLVLRAVGEGQATAAEVARRFEDPAELRGATGWLSVHAGQVVRRPVLVRIEGGALVPFSVGIEY